MCRRKLEKLLSLCYPHFFWEPLPSLLFYPVLWIGAAVFATVPLYPWWLVQGLDMWPKSDQSGAFPQRRWTDAFPPAGEVSRYESGSCGWLCMYGGNLQGESKAEDRDGSWWHLKTYFPLPGSMNLPWCCVAWFLTLCFHSLSSPNSLPINSMFCFSQFRFGVCDLLPSPSI